MRLLIPALLGSALFAQEIPAWVRQAASLPLPDYPPKVTSAFLLREEQLTVDAEGRRVMRERGAIKILQRSASPVATRAYNTKSGRIRDFQGWLLPAGRPEIHYGKDRILDVALSADYTYSEGRAKILECGAGTPPGSVFAWEIVEEERTIFTQYHYTFQEDEPVLVSRFILSLPPGWKAEGVVFNREPVQPAVDGNTYTWELRGLPWIEDEDYTPGFHAVAPRLALSYYPAGDNRAGLRPLKDWRAVSAWMAELEDPQAEVTEAIRAKAADLTKSAQTELDRIRAIAFFAQQVNYVSVQTNLTRGGGYAPHRAGDVLANNYGDCKDKVTLMRALLKAAGIESYPLSIYSRDRQYVRPEWPSPWQFNHAIIAIRVSPETVMPTVLAHPRLGRLLVFDPTDSHTALGDLPDNEQGSPALVDARAEGELIQMPLLPPEASRIESQVQAQMDGDGRLQSRLAIQYFGQSASSLRGLASREGDKELRRVFERAFTRRLGGVTIKTFAPTDWAAEGRLELAVELGSDQFGQLMQGRLLVFKPGAIVSGGYYLFPAKERKLPVKLPAGVRKDSVTIKLPAGFKIDEMPEPVQLRSPYGAFQTRWSAKDGEVSFEQSLEVKDTLAPASDYARLREFFDAIAANQQAPVVLVKQ